MEIRIEKSSHAEESYVEIIQDMYVLCRDLIIYEDKKLIDFEIVLEIRE